MTFKELIQQGIPDVLPDKKYYETSINHAPKRKDIIVLLGEDSVGCVSASVRRQSWSAKLVPP